MSKTRLLTLVLMLCGLQWAKSDGQLVQFRADARNSNGIATERVILGEEFDLNIWVQDLRQSPQGIVAAYLDVTYDDSLVSTIPESLVHGPAFGAVPRGDITTPPLLNEMGSLANGFLDIPPLPPPAGGDEQLLLSVRFAADAIGIADFVGDPADVLPRHSTTLLGFDDAVTLDQLQFSNLALDVVLAPPDINADGRLDTLDVDSLTTVIAEGQHGFRHDLSGDGVVNHNDLSRWLEAAATENGFAGPYSQGDANLDGVVDALDLNVLALNWRGAVSGWSAADFDANGIVDASDLNLLGINWRREIAPLASAVVPEPSLSTTTLLLFFVTTLLPTRRRNS